LILAAHLAPPPGAPDGPFGGETTVETLKGRGCVDTIDENHSQRTM
jgi:hypothetical protein